MASGDDQYHPKDALKSATNGALVIGSAGLLIAAAQNSLSKKNYGAWGLFARGGGTVATFSTLLSIGLVFGRQELMVF